MTEQQVEKILEISRKIAAIKNDKSKWQNCNPITEFRVDDFGYHIFLPITYKEFGELKNQKLKNYDEDIDYWKKELEKL